MIDPAYNIGPFKRIIDVHFGCEGGGLLMFSPAFGANNGWGEPFFDTQDPPVEINPPFGTALDNTSTQNERHKIANAQENSVVTEFADQFAEFPGNKFWTDGTRFLNWWGVPGWGMPDAAGERIYNNNDTTNIGEVGYYYSTGPTISVVEALNSGNNFDITPIDNYNETVYVDDAPHVLPTFHIGNGGRYISGCGMIGNWVIYNDIYAVDTDPGTNIEYINAYNTVTLEYRLLGSFNSDTTGQDFFNMMNVSYSQDGMNFITARQRYDAPNFVWWVNLVRGSIALDVNQDPVSVSISTGTDDYQFSPFYYGYKDNVENAHTWKQTGDFIIDVINWDVDSEFAMGIIYHNEPYPEEDDTQERVPYYLAVMTLGKFYTYDIPHDTGYADMSNPHGPFDGWQGLVDFYSVERIEPHRTNTRFSSVGIKCAGAFITIAYDLFYSYIYPWVHQKSKTRMNYWIKPDGTAVDLGETLLDASVNGNTLSCNPMTVSQKTP